MKKRNILLILAVAAAACALMLIPALTAGGDWDMVVVTLDGKEYARVPLGQSRTVTVEQPSGEVNVIEITPLGAVMASSTCRNQLCVEMGPVTVENWRFRPNGQHIICLPNRVGVELAQAEKTSGTGFYFDTVVTVTLYGAPEGLMAEIWQECARYERLLSKTVPGSDVDRLNNARGETITVDAETWAILREAAAISEGSSGAFSISVAPLTQLWDFTSGTNRMPTEAQRLAALPLVDDSRILLGENNTVTLPAGMSVDLGGIAKGYIADRIAQLLRGRAVGATLNFGGNVYVVGDKPDGSAFSIGIADPAEPQTPLAAVTVKDTSVVTSGVYQRCFTLDGVTYHHILDPRTGLPARTGLASATVIGESSMRADALATACIVLGAEDALALLEQYGLEGMLVTDGGEIIPTPGLQAKYPYIVVE